MKKTEDKKQRIICIDLDGVILHYGKGWLGEDIFGTPVDGVKKYLSKLIEDEWFVIIYTCRGNRKKVEAVLKRNDILRGTHYNLINRRKNVLKGTFKGKFGADCYLDDRAICFRGNWKKSYARITNFSSWEGLKKVM